MIVMCEGRIGVVHSSPAFEIQHQVLGLLADDEWSSVPVKRGKSCQVLLALTVLYR